MKVKSAPANTGSTKKKSKVSADASSFPARYVALNLIVDSDELKYRDLDAEHVEELKRSIMSNGLDTPILVWNGGSDDVTVQFEEGGTKHPATFLVAGQHRREALKEFKQEDKKGFAEKFPEGILCKVMSGPVEEAIAAQIRENVARKNPDGSELLPMMLQLRESGMKNAEISRAIGKSKAYVTGIFDIADEDEDVAEAVKSKKVGVGKGMRLAKEIKKDKKAGKSKEEIKAKVAKATSDGKTDRNKGPKRYSAKAIYAAFEALPHMAQGKQFEIAKAALAYLADPEANELPKQLIPEDKPKAAKPEKKSKKSDKGDKSEKTEAPAKDASKKVKSKK